MAKFKPTLTQTIMAATISLTVSIILTLCGVLYAQQNKKIDKKVDNEVLKQMLCVMNEKNSNFQRQLEDYKIYDEITREEQKEVNEGVLKSLKKLNDTMIRIDAKLEK